MSQSVWLVTVPNNKESTKTTFNTISNRVKDSCELFRFKVPELTVGTLDTLIALSDDLGKISTQVENVVRKVERQYLELSGESPKPLMVNDVTVDAVLNRFQWNTAQFQTEGKQLSELVSQVQAIAGKTDEELKVLSNTYTEKNLALATAKRRQVINLVTSDFEDFLSPEAVAKIDLINTDSLLTITVVVPKALEQEFLNTYHGIGSDIAAYGNPDWSDVTSVGKNDGRFGPALKRNSVKGSPVVPGSKKKIIEEGDMILYAVTVLRGHYESGYFVDDVFTPGKFVDYLEPLKSAFREKRFTVRELVYDSSKTEGVQGAIERAQADLKTCKSSTIRWCQSHFGEVYSAWIHLKVIQAFVESVLRYGLPVDFTAMFLKPDPKLEKELKLKLSNTILELRPELRPKNSLMEDEDEDDSDANLPFVCLRFSVPGST